MCAIQAWTAETQERDNAVVTLGPYCLNGELLTAKFSMQALGNHRLFARRFCWGKRVSFDTYDRWFLWIVREEPAKILQRGAWRSAYYLQHTQAVATHTEEIRRALVGRRAGDGGKQWKKMASFILIPY